MYVYNNSDCTINGTRVLYGTIGFWRYPPDGYVSASTWTIDQLYAGISMRDWWPTATDSDADI
jgi:hypothetical protein